MCSFDIFLRRYLNGVAGISANTVMFYGTPTPPHLFGYAVQTLKWLLAGTTSLLVLLVVTDIIKTRRINNEVGGALFQNPVCSRTVISTAGVRGGGAVPRIHLRCVFAVGPLTPLPRCNVHGTALWGGLLGQSVSSVVLDV